MINSANGEALFSDVDGGELYEPTGFAGIAMDDANYSDDWFGIGKWDPPLRELFKSARISYEFCSVSHRMVSVEFIRCK